MPREFHIILHLRNTALDRNRGGNENIVTQMHMQEGGMCLPSSNTTNQNAGADTRKNKTVTAKIKLKLSSTIS